MKIPDMSEMTGYLQKYIDDNSISTRKNQLSRNIIKCFTKLGKDKGFYVRAGNIFKKLTNDKMQYPNDGDLLHIDLVWIADNPYHQNQNDIIYDRYCLTKAKSEISLALEYEATGGIVKETDDAIHQCDELWKLSFVMARVKVLIYPTHTENIENHITIFRETISNFGIQQQPNPEWRIFAINNDRVIGKIISPLE